MGRLFLRFTKKPTEPGVCGEVCSPEVVRMDPNGMRMFGLKNSPGNSYAEKFDLLLDLFPFPDREDHPDERKRRWRGTEFEIATNRRLSRSYVSALLRGKIARPGREQLRLIALAMGFPEELWYVNPEEWEQLLKERKREGLRGEEFAGGEYLAHLVQKQLDATRFAVAPDNLPPKNTDAYVATQSGGRLSEEEARALRKGDVAVPTLTQILGLTEALRTTLNHWINPYDEFESRQDESDGSVNDRSVKIQDLLKEVEDFTDDQLDLFLSLAKQVNTTGQKNP